MVTSNENVGVAMGLVIAAGAATAIGGAVVFFPSLVKLASRKTLASALGFSSGIMVYVSFAEIFRKSETAFEDSGLDEDTALIYGTLSFFAGVVFTIALECFETLILGGHHHDGDDLDFDHKGTRRETSFPEEEEEEEEEEKEEDLLSDASSIPPYLCHDGNPVETLNRVKAMAESMEVHPDRPHGHGHHNHTAGLQHDGSPDSALAKDPRCVGVCGDKPPAASLTIAPQQTFASGTSPSPVRDEHATQPNILEPLKDEMVVSKPSDEGDEESKQRNNKSESKGKNNKLVRMSLNTSLAIGLHNFPEGLATFVATLDDPKVGAVLAVAIAIHNIPEGLCVSMPVYYATGDRWKAFQWAVISGTSEPVAGLLGWAVLAQSFSDQLYGVLFGLVAGMMVIISVREFLPTAHRYDPKDTVVTYSFMAGMAVMAVSLMMFLV